MDGRRRVPTEWERVGGEAGGTVAGLATVTVEGGSVVFAATPVGVFRSLDAGRSWNLPGGQGTVPLAEAVAVSATFSLDRTVYASGGEGLYRSSDAGETWQRLLVGSRTLSVACSTGDDDRASVVLAATETDGALRSEDGGITWTGANAGLLDLTALALGLAPRFGADRRGFVGTASGLYRTRNGARSWRAVETGLDEPAVQCLAVSPTFAEDGLVLAGTEADGLLLSEDGGSSWRTPLGLDVVGVMALAFSLHYPSNPAIAAATDAGIAISRDGGRSWQIAGAGPGRVLSIAFVADGQNQIVLAGLEREGVARSSDDGTTWESSNSGLSARLLTGLLCLPALAAAPMLFAVGLDSGVQASEDGGRTWTERNQGLAPGAIVHGLSASPAYARDRTLYAATSAGVAVSHDAAASWAASTTRPARAVATDPARGLSSSSAPVPTKPAASQSAPPIAATDLAEAAGEPAGAGAAGPTGGLADGGDVTRGAGAQSGVAIVFAAVGDGSLVASDDAGVGWRVVAAPFEGAAIVSLALSPAYPRDRTLFVASAPLASGGSGEVVVWRSVDGGERWSRWLVERGAGPAVTLTVSPNYPVDELVFVGLGGRVLKPLRHAREVDAGQRRPVWRAAHVGAEDVALTSLAVSPAFARDRTLFAASNVGVFVSRDAGDTFQPWSEGLASPRMIALALSSTYVDDRLVYALGLGGSIWRRRDEP